MTARLSDKDLKQVPGAFWAPDTDIFRFLLQETAREGLGDLAELGVYYGQSSILIGSFRRRGETFTVVDLFSGSSDPDNELENRTQYSGLTKEAFEKNYLFFHDVLPNVVVGPSESITDHARHGKHRFVHVDASHLFEHVVKDIHASKTLLSENGVLALDDIRSPHTPGVAAAAWQSVVTTGLRPFAITPQKLYAAWGNADRWRNAMEDWARSSNAAFETQRVNGSPLLMFHDVGARDPSPLKRYIPEVAWPLATHISRRIRSRKEIR